MHNPKNQILFAEKEKSPALSERSRVMVVDDNATVRAAIDIALRQEYNIVQIESGNKAIELLNIDPHFNVITLDLKMPGLSGIETLMEIKKINPDIEVLILSAHSDVESTRDALKYGAYAYIDKPFNNKKLQEAVKNGISRNLRHSEAKKAAKQLAMVKAQLIESDKFSIIGRLVAGVSHEISNPLTAIIGYSELAAMFGKPSQETKDYIDRIKTSAMLCKSIVEKLLSFSRKNEGEKETIDINSVVESSIDLVEFEAKKNSIELVFDPASESPKVTANYFEIQQVFLNIINNAFHVLREHDNNPGKLTIKVEPTDNTVRIIFTDNGPGILEENINKIFEPLFTTKPKAEGTGLGLSICFEIVKNHGGNIFVGNTGEGARFIVEFPVQGSWEKE